MDPLLAPASITCATRAVEEPGPAQHRPDQPGHAALAPPPPSSHPCPPTTCLVQIDDGLKEGAQQAEKNGQARCALAAETAGLPPHSTCRHGSSVLSWSSVPAPHQHGAWQQLTGPGTLNACPALPCLAPACPAPPCRLPSCRLPASSSFPPAQLLSFPPPSSSVHVAAGRLSQGAPDVGGRQRVGVNCSRQERACRRGG